jgi:hypothetical protein
LVEWPFLTSSYNNGSERGEAVSFLTESIQRGEVGYVGRVRRDLVLESERDLHKNAFLTFVPSLSWQTDHFSDSY